MCGIAGLVSKTNHPSHKEALFSMSRAIKHRGPDGEGFAFFSKTKSVPVFTEDTPFLNRQSSAFSFNPSVPFTEFGSQFILGMAHRRLSILDLSESGHQPMCDVSGDYWISFNGEVYNYLELKQELKQKGHVFVTQTDTEVLIEAYKAWGIDCLQRFNGMFAFALYDKKKSELFCARDRAGVKPFYYTDDSECFAFASEYKAFIKSGLVKFNINEVQQFEFIINGNLELDNESLFKNIKELKPAHYLVYHLSSHQFNINRYYSVPMQVSHKKDTELIQAVEEKIVSAVNLRLRSDVEIGSCLSGGLDSSIIAGIIKQLQPQKELKLFTAVFPGESFDESDYAKSVADSVKGSWHTVSPTSSEFFRDIESLNYFQDLPVWSTSTYSQHRVMQLAAQHQVKVVLDGQGADELFGGYSHHYMALWKESLGLQTIRQMNEAKHTVKQPYQLFAKQLLKDALQLGVNYSDFFQPLYKSYGKSKSFSLESTLNNQLVADYQGKLKSFLKCEDRCSMAFGIESRVPFTDDVDLVNFIFSVEGKRKIKYGISKYLLRESTRKYIPQKVYERKDKIGFETPVGKWFLPHKEQMMETIMSQLDTLLIPDHLKSNFDDLVQKRPSFVLRLYSFAVWKKVFSGI